MCILGLYALARVRIPILHLWSCSVLLLCYAPARCCCFAMHMLGAAGCMCTCVVLPPCYAPAWDCCLHVHLPDAAACMCPCSALTLLSYVAISLCTRRCCLVLPRCAATGAVIICMYARMITLLIHRDIDTFDNYFVHEGDCALHPRGAAVPLPPAWCKYCAVLLLCCALFWCYFDALHLPDGHAGRESWFCCILPAPGCVLIWL